MPGFISIQFYNAAMLVNAGAHGKYRISVKSGSANTAHGINRENPYAVQGLVILIFDLNDLTAAIISIANVGLPISTRHALSQYALEGRRFKYGLTIWCMAGIHSLRTAGIKSRLVGLAVGLITAGGV